MTGKRQAHFRRFFGNGEKDIARRMVVHFDEVDAQLLQLPYGDLGVGCVLCWTAVRKGSGSVVEHWTGENDLRAKQRARTNALAQREDKVRIGAHVART